MVVGLRGIWWVQRHAGSKRSVERLLTALLQKVRLIRRAGFQSTRPLVIDLLTSMCKWIERNFLVEENGGWKESGTAFVDERHLNNLVFEG
ncbi:hypothetical protein T265_09962 [Opisthorchis viverrini]|uniref:Uncharacterized protein n=1 Tax=Opisthorchis viverrini TaxID=6198 RepID=A0A074Z3Z4_OPIVI|nr:hypothetical protein T265_09962 [Opisthorchis viverrini]KER21806.1 hypothetical protein T265_09962 [Opisthorchis viverrini]